MSDEHAASAEAIEAAEQLEAEAQVAELVALPATGQSLVESGVTFVTTNGSRWMKHTTGLDIDYVVAHLDEPALSRFDSLTLMNKLLVVRAVTELSVCRFRQTRKDPDYSLNEYGAWIKVIESLCGDDGIKRLGL